MGMGVTVGMFMFMYMFLIMPLDTALGIHEERPSHREADVILENIHNIVTMNNNNINTNTDQLDDLDKELALINQKITNLQTRIP